MGWVEQQDIQVSFTHVETERIIKPEEIREQIEALNESLKRLKSTMAAAKAKGGGRETGGKSCPATPGSNGGLNPIIVSPRSAGSDENGETKSSEGQASGKHPQPQVWLASCLVQDLLEFICIRWTFDKRCPAEL